MVIDRTVIENDGNFGLTTKTVENIKLIRKH